MRGPKIAIIGAGSYFFGRPVVWNMAHSPILRDGTLALVDTDADVLGTMTDLARRVFEHTESPTKLVASTDRREVLKDADFVVLTFSEKNAHYRGLDTEIALKHGVRMCSSDTIGPGGIFRSLREIPRALDMARDIEELAPYAWTINFVNPTSVLGIALMRHTSLRSFAICDGLHEPHLTLRMCKAVGILPEDAEAVPPEMEARLDIRIGGVNHFTWVLGFEYDGKDYLPRFHERVAERADAERAAANKASDGVDANAHAKAKYNAVYEHELLKVFGYYPNRIAHTKEYVPFFQGYGAASVDPEPLVTFDAKERARNMAARWAETEQYARGEKPTREFVENGRSDHATDIIESMWGGLGKPFYVNTANRGAVTNMADDAFLELRCQIDLRRGPVPQPVGEMPRGLLGLQQQVLDTHELTAEAAVACDRDLLLRALCTDPIVNNISDARAILEESLERQREILPAGWYAKESCVAT